jgi:glycosyltransferase involved in cell wall biosynthesis
VVTEHNVWASHAPLTRIADRLTAGRAEIHLAVSEAVQASLPPAIRARTRVVRYGIDTAAIRARVDRSAARAALGVGDDEVVIGTVATSVRPRGYPTFWRRPHGRRPSPTALRGGRARPARGRAARAIGGSGWATACVPRFPADAVRVMSAFDIFCLASHHEGLPVALMEALALGLPAVATRVGGVAELVTDGVGAVLVPPGEPTRLARRSWRSLKIRHGARRWRAPRPRAAR